MNNDSQDITFKKIIIIKERKASVGEKKLWNAFCLKLMSPLCSL